MGREPFDPLAYRDPTPSPFLMRVLEPVNRRLLLPAVLGVRKIDLPPADEQRLRAAVRKDTAAFLAPNHPEFLTDWLIDKELARRVSPLMAHWAAREIVNRNPLEQSFWLRNNLIANVPGGGGKDYSIRWAMAGHGVLLHPEGKPTWNPGWVAPLLPGVVDLAWETVRALDAEGRATPVYVVPIVWLLRFDRDASRGLHGEMEHVEQALRLESGKALALEKRFEALLWAILLRRREVFGFLGPVGGSALPPHDYFEAQESLSNLLLDTLETRFGAQQGDLEEKLRGLRRAIRTQWEENPESVRLDRKRMREIERLQHFSRAVYDREHLTQEDLAATLKHTRAALLPGETLRNMVPVPAASRTAHVRVLEPIDARARRSQGDEAAARTAWLEEIRAQMQQALDRLGAELASRRKPARLSNPFWTRKVSPR